MSERLEDIAAAIVADGKGLLAADESSGTIKKRFDVIGVESTADNRRDYREMMFRAKEAMTKYISGVILYDETIRQKAADGTPLVDIIKAAGAIPGIKVDVGAKPLAGFPGDTITEGLDGLRERLADYYKLGARFAKWRAVIDIDTAKGVPSATSIASNAHALARYAALCQEAGIVPIVEPEVLMDGAHSIDTCYEVSKATLLKLYGELYAARVVLEGRSSSSRTWSSPARNRARRTVPKRSPRRRSSCFAKPCLWRCPALPSCRAARTTRKRRPTLTPSMSSARIRGSSPSPTAAPCRRPRRRPGAARRRTSPPARLPSSIAPT